MLIQHKTATTAGYSLVGHGAVSSAAVCVFCKGCLRYRFTNYLALREVGTRRCMFELRLYHPTAIRHRPVKCDTGEGQLQSRVKLAAQDCGGGGYTWVMFLCARSESRKSTVVDLLCNAISNYVTRQLVVRWRAGDGRLAII